VAITPFGIAYDPAAGAGDLPVVLIHAGAAHLPSLEQPGRFLALLLEWVANPG
jgi:hypothetical protein